MTDSGKARDRLFQEHFAWIGVFAPVCMDVIQGGDFEKIDVISRSPYFAMNAEAIAEPDSPRRRRRALGILASFLRYNVHIFYSSLCTSNISR